MVAVWWNVNKQTGSNTYSNACSSIKRYHKTLPKTLPLMGAFYVIDQIFGKFFC